MDHARFIQLALCLLRCLEMGTSSIDFVQLSMIYLKTEAESSLGNFVLNKKEHSDG
jgi:hypothetical protein